MAKNFLEELQQTIKDQTNKTPGLVGNLHGAIDTVIAPRAEQSSQSWYVLSADVKTLPSVREFADAFSFQRLPLGEITATQGSAQFPDAGTIPQGRATTFFSSITVAKNDIVPLTVSAPGHQIAIYVDGALLLKGSGSVGAQLSLGAGSHFVAVICYGGTNPIVLTAPEKYSFSKAEPTPDAPRWTDVPLVDYLKAANGSYIVTLQWQNDPYASAWQVYRSEATRLATITSFTPGALYATVRVDQVLDVEAGTELFTEKFHGGQILVVTPGATYTDVEVQLDPQAPADAPSWVGLGFFHSNEQYHSLGKQTYSGNPVITFRDTTGAQGSVYVYRVTAFGFISGVAESDYSDPQWALVDDLTPPGNIVLTPSTDITIVNGEAHVSFTAPADSDYNGVKVYRDNGGSPLLVQTEYGTPNGRDALAFRPSIPDTYWFRTFDTSGNIQTAGVSWVWDGTQNYARAISGLLTAVLNSSNKADLTFALSAATAAYPITVQFYKDSLATGLLTLATGVTSVTFNADGSISKTDYAGLGDIILTAGLTPFWAKITDRDGHVTYAQAVLTDTTLFDGDVKLVLDGAGNLSLHVTQGAGTPLSFGYTFSTTAFDFDTTHQTLVDFTSGEQVVSITPLTNGEAAYAVVWFYQNTAGGGVRSVPRKDQVVYINNSATSTAVSPKFDYLIPVRDLTILSEVRIDVSLRLTDPGSLGGTLKAWVNKDGTATADPTAAPDATLAIASTPRVVGPSDWTYLHDLLSNNAADKLVYFEFVNSNGLTTGKKELKLPQGNSIITPDGSLAHGIVDVPSFVANVRPVRIVATLPASGDVAGDVVFLTTDSKLHRWTGTAWTTAIPTTDLTGQVSSSQVADAAITTTKFAAGIRPVEILGALPAASTVGRTVFLTTDNKLYRDTGTAWTAAVPTTDLSGLLASGQLADQAIDLRKLATALANGLAFADVRNKVLNPSFEDGSAYWSTGAGINFVTNSANAHTGNKYVEVTSATSLDVHQFDDTGVARYFEVRPGDVIKFGCYAQRVSGDGQPVVTLVSVDKDKNNAVGHQSNGSTGPYALVTGTYTALATDKYVRIKLTVNGMTVSSIYRFDDVFMIIETPGTDIVARSIQADRIVAGTLTANEIAARTIVAGNIVAGTLTANELAARTITATQIAAGTITANEIAADTITAGQIAAGAITASELSARSVSLEKLFVGSFDNLCLDPGFEQASSSSITAGGSVGWTQSGYGNGGGTFAIVTTNVRSGNQALQFNPAGLANGAGTFFGANGSNSNPAYHVACTEGDQFYFEAWVRKVGTGTPCQFGVGLRWSDKTGTNIGTPSSGLMSPTQTYQKVNVVATAPANAVSVTPFLWFVGVTGATELLNIDDAYARRMVTGSIVVDGTITAQQIAANTITASQIAAGTITGDRLVAGTITAAQIAARSVALETLFVGSYDNLCLDPGFEQTTGLNVATGWSTIGYSSAGGSLSVVTSNVRSGNQAVQFNPAGQTNTTAFGANGSNGVLAKHVAATEGDQFYFEYWVRKVGTGTPPNTVAVIRFMKADNSTISTINGVTIAPTQTYQKISVVGTCPANTAYVVFQINMVFVSGATELVNIDDAYARRMVTGSIMVDGTITAAKIVAGTITANELAANSVTASQIQAGAVTAGKISITQLSDVVTNLGIVVSGTLRNSASTRYLNLNADGTGLYPDFLHHESIQLKNDGSATFSGTVSSSTFSATNALFADTVTVGSQVSNGGTIKWPGLGGSTHAAIGWASDGINVSTGELYVASTRVAKVISSVSAPSGTAPEGTLWVQY